MSKILKNYQNLLTMIFDLVISPFFFFFFPSQYGQNINLQFILCIKRELKKLYKFILDFLSLSEKKKKEKKKKITKWLGFLKILELWTKTLCLISSEINVKHMKFLLNKFHIQFYPTSTIASGLLKYFSKVESSFKLESFFLTFSCSEFYFDNVCFNLILKLKNVLSKYPHSNI